MILFIGIASESPMRMAAESATAAGIPYLFLDQQEMHLHNLFTGFSRNRFSGKLQVRDKDYSLEGFTGIYYRMMDYQAMPQCQPHHLKFMGADNVQKSGLMHQQLLYWMDMTGIRVLNPPWTMGSNLSKPYQSQWIREAGFLVPATCICSNKTDFQAFQSAHKSLIYKSISAIRSIVQDFGSEQEPMLDRLAYLPTQFQQKLDGSNIRVHVVGDQLFATLIESNVTDYRYAHRQQQTATPVAYQLPKKIGGQCFKLSQLLNLPLCGIDLFLDRAGNWYCFEVNPSPGYSYFQSHSGQDISGAIVKWLHSGTAK